MTLMGLRFEHKLTITCIHLHIQTSLCTFAWRNLWSLEIKIATSKDWTDWALHRLIIAEAQHMSEGAIYI